MGTTPAWACSEAWRGKHPHGRGDDYYRPRESEKPLETPPRAWGRRIPAAALAALEGNTPTGVGTTERDALVEQVA